MCLHLLLYTHCDFPYHNNMQIDIAYRFALQCISTTLKFEVMNSLIQKKLIYSKLVSDYIFTYSFIFNGFLLDLKVKSNSCKYSIIQHSKYVSFVSLSNEWCVIARHSAIVVNGII